MPGRLPEEIISGVRNNGVRLHTTTRQPIHLDQGKVPVSAQPKIGNSQRNAKLPAARLAAESRDRQTSPEDRVLLTIFIDLGECVARAEEIADRLSHAPNDDEKQ